LAAWPGIPGIVRQRLSTRYIVIANQQAKAQHESISLGPTLLDDRLRVDVNAKDGVLVFPSRITTDYLTRLSLIRSRCAPTGRLPATAAITLGPTGGPLGNAPVTGSCHQ
jgi:hypothetical protein